MMINGKQTPLPPGGATLKGFLEANGYDITIIAVAKNGVIVNKGSPAFITEPLRDDDVIELVRFVGGG
jgi:thiamine biosynthesis protein ThiS